jgi:N-acetylglutamate synthase
MRIPRSASSTDSGRAIIWQPGVVRSRLQILITPADVGSRVSVRSRIAPDRPGAPSTTDTVGYLLAWTDQELRIQRRDGTVTTVASSDLLAGKVLEGPPPQRRGGYPARGEP